MLKEKINFKFVRNILIGIIALIIAEFIVNIAPGFKRDKYANITNLVIADTNVTEQLKHIVYINEDGVVYLSKDDISNLIDNTIYHDEKTDTIITTSYKVATSMKIGETVIHKNGVSSETKGPIVYLEGIMYIPVSEFEEVYNIKVDYIKDTDVVVIDDLDKGLITAELNEDTTMKYRPRLSKNVMDVKTGEKVYAFYTTSKGWRQIRTENGQIGYVKANTLTNEMIVRTDTNQQQEAKKISIDIQNAEKQQADGKEITVKNLFEINSSGLVLKEALPTIRTNNERIWTTISNNGADFTDYTNRDKIINNIINLANTAKINGIIINMDGNTPGLNRLIIELTPRLRAIGVYVSVVQNEGIDENTYKTIVDYMISK